MLRKLRITLAALVFAGITLLFLDVSGVLHTWLGWLAKIQFFPAVLALNVAVVAVLVVLTLLLGRVYCSVICPLGIFQDIVSWIHGRRKKARFAWKGELKWLRYGMLALFLVALVAGVQVFVALLEPYSAFGRMTQNLLGPLYGWGNNLLAWISERADGYAFYPREVWVRSLPTFLIALLTFVLVVVLAWTGGRTWCNSICPVGTILSFFSRFAMFRPVIDADKCKNCKVCEHKCKASCIDITRHKIDYSRCVDCFDCLDNCKFGALQYRFAWGKSTGASPAAVKGTKAAQDSPSNTDAGRRNFLAVSALFGAGALAQAQKKRDGGFAEILPKTRPERTVPLTPPGSGSPKHFYDRCTACQLCVSACPNGVLRPSASLEHLMQPEMSYERGYCRPECTVCADVCPAGAILPLTPEEKTQVHIGIATVNRDLCVVEADGVSCGNCARHCPTGAILMVHSVADDPQSLLIPVVNEDRCIGCGACENLCPARPLSAITVNGRSTHIIG